MLGFAAPLLFEDPILYSSYANYSSGIRWTRVTTSWVPTCAYKWMLGFPFFLFSPFFPFFLLSSITPSLAPSFLSFILPFFLSLSCGGQGKTIKSQLYSSAMWLLEIQLGSPALVANTSILLSVSLALLLIFVVVFAAAVWCCCCHSRGVLCLVGF